MQLVQSAIPHKNAGPVDHDPAVSSGERAWLKVNKVFVPNVTVAPVEAIRVWTDARGKTHFEYLPIRETHTSGSCSHTGTLSKGGRRVPYTWARSSTLHPQRGLLSLHCGDCGAALE